MYQKANGSQNTSSLSNRYRLLVQNNSRVIVGAIVFVFLVGVFTSQTRSSSDEQSVGSPVGVDYTVDIAGQNKAGDTLNKNLSVTITEARRQKRVLVQGSWIKAKEGKVFLILDFDVTNSVGAAMYGMPVDWVRLIRDEDKKVAPTVHQGQLELRPVASKETNVGFVVDEDSKEFTVELGRIYGLEDTLQLEF